LFALQHFKVRRIAAGHDCLAACRDQVCRKAMSIGMTPWLDESGGVGHSS
jgi:hypothetical protein